MTPDEKLNSYYRLQQRRIAGYGTSIHDFAMNFNQAYNRFTTSFDPAEKKEMWRIMHLLAKDIYTVTDGACPEPEGQIYKQLAAE